MKKYLSTCLILVFIFFSCGGNVSKNPEDIKNVKTDSIVATNVLDSIAMIANSIDSLRNRGALFHLDKYAIGKFKGIEVSVEKSSIESKSLTYINLRKDCGGEYYYSWEDARIYQKELPSLYSAINSIKDNLGRNVDHEELIAYTTKDLVTIKAECKDANKWKIIFSVDLSKSNSYVNLTIDELDKMVDLIKTAEIKLKEIEATM